MRVYRLSRKKYAHELSGKGASLSGNRWNGKGTEIIYTSQSRALAMAEVAVRLTKETMPKDYVMLEIKIPDNISIQTIPNNLLPKNWNTHPPSILTQKLGDSFIQTLNNCVLKVPSAVVPGDFNLLINPYHKEFIKISIIETVPFPFDDRLFI